MIVLGFDTETKGLDWFDPEQGAFLISWADDRGSWVASVNNEQGVDAFKRAVARADVLVAHNLSFDVHQVREAIGIDLLNLGKSCEDTDILARIALPERAWLGGEDGGYKLKNLAKTYLRADAGNAEQVIEELAESIGVKLKSTGGYYEVWRAYPREMEEYALLDAEYARDLHPLLLQKLDDRTRGAWELERDVAPIIIRAEERGVRVDPSVVAQLRAEYEPLEADARERVEAALGDTNLNSPLQLREKLLELDVPLYRTTDTGELTTNKWALAEFEDRFPFLKDLADWRAADKMLSTYIGPMTGRDVVHTSFWQVGTRTHRMSCSRPNMQNMPARDEPGDTKLRQVFIPREGYCYLVYDFDSIELRMLAYYLNRPEFKAQIEDGFDTFAWLASEVWGGAPEDYFKGTPGQGRRGEAKNVTYAIIYGAGIKRVADMLAVDRTEGKRIVTTIKRALPGYFQLKKRIDNKVKSVGFVHCVDGRKLSVGRDKSYVGLNTIIQGGAAGIFKRAVLDVVRALEHLDAEPVLFVHDELVVECLKEHAGEAGPLMVAAMEGASDITPAIKVTGAIAYNNYAEAK